MLLALFHLLTGCSLVEINEISKLAQIGNISDVAFMKRFNNCNEWFKWILSEIQHSTKGIIEYRIPDRLSKYRILAVDASDVSEKGTSRRIFRLHFALDIGRMHAALYNITDNKIGERLRNFDLSQDDLVLADRAYSNITDIEYCLERGCQYLLRLRTNSFKTYDAEGNALNLLSIMEEKRAGEINAFIHVNRGENIGKSIPVRICFMRKSDAALVATKKTLKKKEIKKKVTIQVRFDYFCTGVQ